jgi:hypothetical protein
LDCLRRSPVRSHFPLPDDDRLPSRQYLSGLFVLASHYRLARQPDKRSHLDLQIDLLAEREMTAVLQAPDIARHLEVQTTVTPEQLCDLMTRTDLRRLTTSMEELAEPATPTTSRGVDAGAARNGRPAAQHLQFATIVGALNRAYAIEEGRPRWKVRLVAIGLTLGVAASARTILRSSHGGPRVRATANARADRAGWRSNALERR